MARRILFIHAAAPGLIEYSVQRIILAHTDPEQVDPYLVWQTHTADPALDKPLQTGRGDRNLFLDLGRDIEVPSWPPRVGRALLMARRVPFALPALLRFADAARPDLIYTTQQLVDVYLGRLLALRARRPHFVHVHYPVGRWLGPGIVPMIRSARGVIVVSEFIRQVAISAGVPADRIRVVHATRPLEDYSRERERGPFRRELGIAPEAPLVAAVGRLDPGKGHQHTLRAFARVVQRVPQARLVIVGGTTTRDGFDQSLLKLAAELGLEGKAIFTGTRADVAQIYADADIFCLPTENDACPVVFLEAMASRLPVVAVRSGGVPEMVVHGETGLLGEPGDADALADNLLRLLLDEPERRRFAQSGSERAARLFAPQVVAQQWVDSVRELL